MSKLGLYIVKYNIVVVCNINNTKYISLYSFGVGLFIYQSLDAIDGKQARRTQTSGPLGELFDHGCDALNTTLGVLTWASSTYLGQSWWTVASLFATLGNFYLSTWEEYHTGTLYLGYFSGPVEGVLMLCGVHLMSGYFGPAIWMLRLNEVLPFIPFDINKQTQLLGALQLNHILIVVGGVVTLINIVTGYVYVVLYIKKKVPNIIIYSLRNVIRVKLYPTETSLKNDSSILKATLGLAPYVYMWVFAFTWLNLWPDIVTEHLSIFSLFFGLAFGHQLGLMITAHVSKMAFPMINNQVLLMLSSGCTIAYFEPFIQE